MKSILMCLMLVVIFFSFSCNKQTCDLGDKYARKYSQGLADRWKCDYTKIYADMTKILDSTVCQNTPTARISLTGDVAMLACNAVMTAVSKFGGLYLEAKWGCDASLVSKDLDKMTVSCSLIGLL
jgi:hypothetical protein